MHQACSNLFSKMANYFLVLKVLFLNSFWIKKPPPLQLNLSGIKSHYLHTCTPDIHHAWKRQTKADTKCEQMTYGKATSGSSDQISSDGPTATATTTTSAKLNSNLLVVAISPILPNQHFSSVQCNVQFLFCAVLVPCLEYDVTLIVRRASSSKAPESFQNCIADSASSVGFLSLFLFLPVHLQYLSISRFFFLFSLFSAFLWNDPADDQ